MFTGTPVITLITEGLVRITGLSLVKFETGEIGTSDSDAEILLPDQFMPRRYELAGAIVSQADAVQVSIEFAEPPPDPVSISIQKSSAPFVATIENSSGSTTPELEIYVRYQ